MKGLLKQDHEVLFQRIRTFRDKLTSANHEGGFFNLLRGLKRFILSLMDYRQDCKTVFHSLLQPFFVSTLLEHCVTTQRTAV